MSYSFGFEIPSQFLAFLWGFVLGTNQYVLIVRILLRLVFLRWFEL